MHRRCLIPAALVLLLTTACGDSPTSSGTSSGDRVATVTLQPPASRTIEVGGTIRLVVKATSQNGAVVSEAIPSWASSDTSIASVTPDGIVKGKGWGEAVISAAVGTVQDTLSLFVLPPDPTIAPDAQIIELAAGFSTTCALTATHRLYCWGENRFGEFGDGTGTPSTTPRRIPAPVPFAHIYGTRGTSRLCGIGEAGDAYCSGYNVNGEIGDGTNLDRAEFSRVGTAMAFQQLATSYHSCGLTPDGQAYCWGGNLSGEMGTGSASSGLFPSPTRVAGDRRYRAITTGLQISCGLDVAGVAYCWGLLPGNGGIAASPVPVPVDGGRTYLEIGSGNLHTCAREQSGIVYCWGADSFGRVFARSPAAVYYGQPFTRLAVGENLTCGLGADSTAVCWAPGGQPAAVPGRLRYVGLAVGTSYACGYTRGGAAYCWGDNFNGQFGNGTTQSRNWPTRVSALPTE
jgi:hypothetical protein